MVDAVTGSGWSTNVLRGASEPRLAPSRAFSWQAALPARMTVQAMWRSVFFKHAAFESSLVSFMYRPRDLRYASNDTRRTLFRCQRSALALHESLIE